MSTALAENTGAKNNLQRLIDQLAEEAPAPAAPEAAPAPAAPAAPEAAPAPVAPAPAAPEAAPAPAAPAPEAPLTPATKVAKDDAGSGPDLAEAERIRRKAAEIEGLKLLQEAYALLNKGEYEQCIPLFEQALAKIPPRAATDDAITKAKWGLGEAAMQMAEKNYGKVGYAREDLSNSERFIAEADKYLNIALKDEAGHGEDARRLLRRTGAAAAKIKERAGIPIPPKYRADHVETVKSNEALLDEGRKFYELEEYDKAEDNFTRMLRTDPYNKDAMKFLRRIEERRLAFTELHRKTSRVDMIQDVRERWNPPLRAQADTSVVRPQKRPTVTGGSRELMTKLQSIVIPSIEFRQANIIDVVNFLRDASEETDPNKTGVNILLKLPAASETTATGAAAPAPETPAPGAAPQEGAPAATPPDFGAAPAPAADAAADGFGAAPTPSAEVKITLKLRRVTLLDAIRYVTDMAGLKYRIEDNAVIITPRNQIEGIVTRMYPVQPNILEITSARTAQTSQEQAAARQQDFVGMGDSTTSIDRNTDVRKFFESQGVPFPPGTSIAYNQSISQLIVRNTAENLEILERIIQQLDVIPKQVEIEARFVEVAQNDLNELGFEWLLTDNWEVARNPKTGGQLVIPSSTGGFTGGNRYMGTSTSSDQPTGIARDATSTFLGGIATVQSILTNPELSLVIHALEQKGGADVLSCPRVTTKSGVNAFIKVVEELIYPTEFESQDAGQTTFMPGVGGEAPVPIQRPPVPSSFETREVGVILNVTPIVGADGQTVDLTLVPEVAEFVRWVDYGPPDLYPILQPVFASRNVTTSVTVWNGQTIVMGGLIREQESTIDDRIPVLGDIPLLGRLFRSKGSYARKQNLMIFVTAKIVDPAGNAIGRGPAGITSGPAPETTGSTTGTTTGTTP